MTDIGYLSFFDEHHEWGRSYDSVSPGERSRLDALVDLLPPGGRVLDAGCGDGVLTNLLLNRGADVTGLDISVAALQHVRAPSVCGSTEALPFDDRSFTTIVSSNVMEHLPAGSFERTLAEFERVAARYVLLSFPHREELVLAQTRCGRCETTFHASRHVRSIDIADVASWFPSFRVAGHRLSGDPWPYRSRRLQRLAQLTGNVWYRTRAVCPTCGYPVEPPVPSQVVRTGNGTVQRILGFVRGTRPSQLVILLERM